MANIMTLVSDIYDMSQGRRIPAEGTIARGGGRYLGHLDSLVNPPAERPELKPKALHASKIGKNCLRQMWCGQWTPILGEPLQPHTLIKFTYGDLVEEMALDLARLSGHDVSCEQQRVEFPTDNGFTVSGRLDAVIDGYVVDVKSTSPYSFANWNNKQLTAENDSFGYRWQLHTYARALTSVEVDKERGYLLLLDKQNGHIGLSECVYDWQAYDLRLKIITTALNDHTTMPPRNFTTDGVDRLGNEKLGVECGYCDFKKECWGVRDIKGVLRGGKVTWLVAAKDGGKVRLKPGEVAL